MSNLSCTILFVDDDQLLLETYSEILPVNGYKVCPATNPYEALQIVQKEKIDLAILDYNLPFMTGKQLGHLISKTQNSVKIIFVSGNSSIHKLLNNVDYKVYDIISKPFSIETLLSSIKLIINDECNQIIKPQISKVEQSIS